MSGIIKTPTEAEKGHKLGIKDVHICY